MNNINCGNVLFLPLVVIYAIYNHFIIIVDTLPSLPASSDNEIKKNVPISDEGIIVITDTDDDNPPKGYI